MKRQSYYSPFQYQYAGVSQHGQRTALQSKKPVSPERAQFIVRILQAEQAAALLNTPAAAHCRKGGLVFYLQRQAPVGKRVKTNTAIDSVGFCIVRGNSDLAITPAKALPSNKAKEQTPAAVPYVAENIIQTHQSKKFLEIILLHIADTQKTPRAKTLLLRALADYCRRQNMDYICGQFSFNGKYPAAYAQEFSCLYHHYRLQTTLSQTSATVTKHVSMDIIPKEAVSKKQSYKNLPPLLRYCLRLGAKTGDYVAVDNHSNQGMGYMNVFLLMPLRKMSTEQTNMLVETIPK